MKPFLLTLCFYATSIQLLAQSFSLEGKVIASSSNEPLPFATLSIANGTRGTISNASGEFRLILKEEDRGDSLRVSYVGFHTQFIPMAHINSSKLEIKMVEKEEVLKEVEVISLSATQILERAINSIPKNYYSKAYSSRGFYRLSSKKNDQYVHLSEAVFDMYRSKEPNEVDLFRLESWRGITDKKEAHSIFIGRTPNSIFGLDEVNVKGFTKTFNGKKFLKEHRCVLEGEFIYDEKPVYLISFDQKEGVKNLGYQGKFYISKGDFAFLEVEYGISPQSLKYYKLSVGFAALTTLLGIKVKKLGENTRVRYKQSGEKYYLNDVAFTTDMRFQSDRHHYNFVLNMKGDYLVSEIAIENPVKINEDEALPHGKMIENQHAPYDSLFWKDYTIVLPDSDFGEISRTITESNKANDTKEQVEHRLNKFPKEPAVRIDSILTFYHQKNLFHGNALIAFEGKPILNKSYPYPDQQLDSESRFRIGSTSKTFTSMLILMLEKEGLINLSDPISNYIPSYRHGEVTIDQLLSHQSGIPDYLSDAEDLAAIYDNSYTINELVQNFCSKPLEFQPDSSFTYSNSGYVLLAKIAESASGKSFSRLLEEKIFKPLGMENTSFGLNPDKQSPVIGYYYGRPEPLYPIENAIGAGGVISTTGDLLKWSNALESGNIVDPSLVDMAMTPRAEYVDWKADYGYGWMIDKYFFSYSKKHKLVYHPGTSTGFYSMFLKQPDEGISIILLSNAGDFPRFEMTDLILEVLN